METETITAPRLEAAGQWDDKAKPLVLVLTTIDTPGRIERVRVPVTLDELQGIVDAAYVQHGILAVPDYGTEAERALDAMRTELDAAHNTGVRA